MELGKCVLLALHLVCCASAIRGEMGARCSPPRKTSRTGQLEKFETEAQSVPTSRPEFADMLVLRNDYSLPSDYCGWDANYKSVSFTCNQVGASCINYGSIRGCCSGPPTACASSTFFSVCIPLASKPATCRNGQGTACCTGTDYPECGTILMSSRANPDIIYTMINCWKPGYGSTYYMQDYPAGDSYTASPTTTTTSSTTSTTIQPPLSDPAPVGAIVGGVIGGLALLTIILATSIFIMKRRKPANQSHEGFPGSNSGVAELPMPFDPTMALQQPTSPGSPPSYYNPSGHFQHDNAPTSPISPYGQYSVAPLSYPPPQKQDGMPAAQGVVEVPANYVTGTGSNRAELG